ncbi:hypothetical protein Q3G72_029180 [Acer saccharum]|nr:hypothetical protein Q3G72_029180 [Acer saccharum]
MAEQEIVEFDEVYDPDIENAQQRECQATSREARHFAIILREKQIFSSYPSEFLPHSPGLIETSVIRLELHYKNHAIDAGDFTALNIPPASQRCRKTDLKIEKTVQLTGAPRAKNINEKAASEQNRSYLHKICPVKVRNESRFNIYHVLLLISTLLATITFHIALKFYLPGCRFQKGYESSSSLNPICQTENQRSYSNRILITFNSVVFFLSTALMMILFDELPFRPWLQVLVFSMICSYMCTFMDPVNPSSFSS